MLELFTHLVATYGYLGIFIVSLIGSASVFIPLPSFLAVIAAGATLNPFWVGVVAGFGAAIGELIGYLVGAGIVAGGKRLTHRKLNSKERHWVKRVNDWFNRGWGPAAIFLFAATPLPDKILGVVCGALRYDWKKFFVASLAGKILLHIVLAYIGYFGIEFFLKFIH